MLFLLFQSRCLLLIYFRCWPGPTTGAVQAFRTIKPPCQDVKLPLHPISLVPAKSGLKIILMSNFFLPMAGTVSLCSGWPVIRPQLWVKPMREGGAEADQDPVFVPGPSPFLPEESPDFGKGNLSRMHLQSPLWLCHSCTSSNIGMNLFILYVFTPLWLHSQK